MSPPIPKMITDAVYLTRVLERMVRFLTAGHVSGYIMIAPTPLNPPLLLIFLDSNQCGCTCNIKLFSKISIYNWIKNCIF